MASHYLSILDITDPSTITKVELDVNCQYLTINQAEDRIYCSSDTKLFTIDITDKNNPVKIHEQD